MDRPRAPEISEPPILSWSGLEKKMGRTLWVGHPMVMMGKHTRANLKDGRTTHNYYYYYNHGKDGWSYLKFICNNRPNFLSYFNYIRHEAINLQKKTLNCRVGFWWPSHSMSSFTIAYNRNESNFCLLLINRVILHWHALLKDYNIPLHPPSRCWKRLAGSDRCPWFSRGTRSFCLIWVLNKRKQGFIME